MDLEYRAVDLEGTTEPKGRLGRKVGAIDEESYRVLLRREVHAAVDFYQSQIAEKRAEATKYYNGEKFGDEEEGRSQVVATTTSDVVSAIMPSLLRVFASNDNAVEYAPAGPDDVEQARIRTAYVRHVFFTDNPGFMVLHALLKDALIREYGVAMWWWEESERVEEYEYSGLSEEDLAVLMDDEKLEVTVTEESEETVPGPEGAPQKITVYSATVKRTATDGRVRIAAIPGEEFLIDRDARTIDEAKLVGRKRRVRVGDLTALGYDAQTILDNLGTTEETESEEEIERDRRRTDHPKDGSSIDPMMLEVDYYELYLRTDKDGDGIPEIRRVCAIGPQVFPLSDKIVAERPFADLCPDPEAHAFGGRGVYDKTKDLQRIDTALIRNLLDSLAQSIHPRTVVVEGEVNIDDVMNPEVGGVIRATRPGMVQEFAKEFRGKEIMPVLDYMRTVKENRTGVSDRTTGLNAEALQSSTQSAVLAATSASMQQIELIARILAEHGLTRIFRGLLRLVVQHQDRPRTIRVASGWVQVDPRTWDTECDIIVNVGVGTGRTEEKVGVLRESIPVAMQVLQAMGPGNPLFGLHHLRNMLAKAYELSGFRDVSAFIGDVPEGWQPPQPEGGQQDPAMLLAQVEQQKAAVEMQVAYAKLELERQKAKWEDDRERDKQAADFELKRAEIAAKYGAQVNEQAVKAEVERDRNAEQAAVARENNERKAQIAEQAAAAQPAGGEA